MAAPNPSRSPSILMGSEMPRFCTKEIRGRSVPFCHVTRIRRNSVVTYEQPYEALPSAPRNVNSLLNLKKAKLRGQISQATSRKCRAMLQGWSNSLKCAIGGEDKAMVKEKFGLAMVTVTLCADQVHDDNYLKRHMLYGFLRDLQRYHGVVHYYWRAEAQANKRIHFHIIIDAFVPFEDLDREWYKQLAAHGYLQRYQESTGSLFPPSVNVIGLSENPALFDYVCKYATKTIVQLPKFSIVDGVRTKHYFFIKIEDFEQCGATCRHYRAIEGRDWGCSDGLRSISDFKVIESEYSERLIEGLATSGKGRVIEFDRARVIVGNVIEWLRASGSSLYRGWVSHHQLQFKMLYLSLDWLPPPWWDKSDDCVAFRYSMRGWNCNNFNKYAL